ncbi:MAG: hypothetical protein LBD23_10680 [Oscillospiraceae bacterium]|jgi:hypothetical protein|nr:hypothetical protein [Oscillospiraceae bacterium]
MINITSNEKNILRELASQYAKIATEARQQEIRKRMRNLNDLKNVRPIVLMDEIPWHELNIDDRLTCKCSDPLAVEMETYFRRALLQYDYFPCDRLYEYCYILYKTILNDGGGIGEKAKIVKVDDDNYIVSHCYEDQLRDEDDIEKLGRPLLRVDTALDAERKSAAEEVLAGILPVRLQGIWNSFAPWDMIPRLHGGVTTVFMDLMDRPDFMHAIMRRMTENKQSAMEQYEALGLLDAEQTIIHCTPALCSDIPSADDTGGNYRLKDIWMRSTAQMFSDVSPQLHKEFEFDYQFPLFEKCGLVYYGCCEALHNKIDLLKVVPNLRKVGVSPWADVRSCAEQLGKDYVLSLKPNPAAVAIKTEPDVVRAELSIALEAIRDNDCRADIVLKDTSTAGYDINNLKLWNDTVLETLDAFGY